MDRFVQFFPDESSRIAPMRSINCDEIDSLFERWTDASLLDRVCSEGYEADHLQGES